MHWLGNLLVVLSPRGTIALSERGLMIHAVEFMLIVAIPIYILLFFFAWHYRAGNKKAKYMPDWENSKMDELVWWAIPFEIVLILGALTWGSTHTLDPRKPIGTTPPLVVQVVALQWKWLFIYPAQGIATVNYLQIPVGQPVEFEVTADAPMNSFWIPRLGGQIYAMTGMVNPINLEASAPGVYQGGSSNYSGVGFAQMQFKTQAVSKTDFDTWVAQTKAASTTLTLTDFDVLAAPSVPAGPTQYASVEKNLYNEIVGKFMSPQSSVDMNDE